MRMLREIPEAKPALPFGSHKMCLMGGKRGEVVKKTRVMGCVLHVRLSSQLVGKNKQHEII